MASTQSSHARSIEKLLNSGPLTSNMLCESLGLSQPTVSRALKSMGADVLRFNIHKSIHYLLRDHARGHLIAPIARVTKDGQLQRLGVLEPVRPEGFVLLGATGQDSYSEGLPWWLFDMRPQGYLGRAFVHKNAKQWELPERLVDWSDTNVLQALHLYGDDLPGNVLVGERSEQVFINQPMPTPLGLDGRGQAYATLSAKADAGDIAGSSAGGEQPKFTAYVQTEDGPAHVIVKFTARDNNAISERWRDLLRAEHHALEVLRQAGVPAAKTQIVDSQGQRFLEVVRFDRIGALGRAALLSLSALDAEFVGIGSSWYAITRALVQAQCVVPEAAQGADLLWAYGTLIGNTDMHAGNLSFTTDSGRPYALAPAYDMTPMAFAPKASGAIASTLAPATIVAAISGEIWRKAYVLAVSFAARLRNDAQLSERFAPCIAALDEHLDIAKQRIDRIA
ncbi:type II toxin-antitoxin system HipA family toxin YjjJ [Lampropedia aestuarii]|uniref:Type II toxin-antitoxin system HipA family toxin YjjJ n=1 Tax=Lampropedia aestuarii TaxID=2562762 RepID=A0A4S5BID1_9BURK|nr:type II toxin-antitoxin system HipA family toxin YjjJ [Lampropedia aestuarii]THJ32174.1 type II toxin-antitoxin system HipA family toxin YjjJ [Lampropedia aestuarii]